MHKINIHIIHIMYAVGTQKICLNEKAFLGTPSCKANVKPFMPNEISLLYQMDESISNLRVGKFLDGKFQFHSKIKKCILYKQRVQNLIRHCILQCLISFCTLCRCPIKRTPGLNGLKLADYKKLFKILCQNIGLFVRT